MPQPLYKQGDLVDLVDPQQLPDGTCLYHPFLIINSNRSISYQHYYTGVMMTATAHINRLSFACEDNMFEAPLKEFSHLNMFLTAGFCESAIKRFRNRMKPIHFKGFMEQMKEVIFCVD
jgi:hypothetical protein